MKPLGRMTAVLSIVIIVLGGVIGVVYVSDQSIISSQSSAINLQSQSIIGQQATIQSQSSNLVKDQSSLTKLDANITATQAVLAKDQANAANLSATIGSDKSEIASITASYSQANATISTLQAEVAPLQAKVTSLQNQLNSLDTQITGLQAQIATLQTQVKSLTSIVDLGQSDTVVSQQLEPVPSLGDQVVSKFDANYSGYVTVTMTQISDINNVQVGVIILFGNSVNSGQYASEPLGPYAFTSVPGTIVFPVTPGSVSVYLTNADSSPGNATLSINYYY